MKTKSKKSALVLVSTVFYLFTVLVNLLAAQLYGNKIKALQNCVCVPPPLSTNLLSFSACNITAQQQPKMVILFLSVKVKFHHRRVSFIESLENGQKIRNCLRKGKGLLKISPPPYGNFLGKCEYMRSSAGSTLSFNSWSLKVLTGMSYKDLN